MVITTPPHSIDSPRWATARLEGGPFRGQIVVLPVDQLTHTVYDDASPHVYARDQRGAPVLRHLDGQDEGGRR